MSETPITPEDLLVHYGSHGSAECGADEANMRLTTVAAHVTCRTCRGWLPIVAPELQEVQKVRTVPEMLRLFRMAPKEASRRMPWAPDWPLDRLMVEAAAALEAAQQREQRANSGWDTALTEIERLRNLFAFKPTPQEADSVVARVRQRYRHISDDEDFILLERALINLTRDNSTLREREQAIRALIVELSRIQRFESSYAEGLQDERHVVAAQLKW